MRYYVQSSWADVGSRVGTYYTSLDKAKEVAKKSKQYYVFDGKGTIVWPKHISTKAKIERAVLWANAVTADKRHGYNNAEGYRWGQQGDYACSTLVITAYEQAGVPVKTNGATVTANMKDAFLKSGFEDVTKKVNFKTCEGMERGDVLIKPGAHTEIYIGSKRLIGARGNAPSGKPENGVRGDQTGGEIAKSGYYNFPWTICLRYTGLKNYKVQVGAFETRANAVKKQTEIKDALGIKMSINKSGKYYRVMSAAMTKSDAMALMKKLATKKLQAVVIAV